MVAIKEMWYLFQVSASPEALPSYFLLHNFGEAEDPENDLLTDQELLKRIYFIFSMHLSKFQWMDQTD